MTLLLTAISLISLFGLTGCKGNYEIVTAHDRFGVFSGYLCKAKSGMRSTEVTFFCTTDFDQCLAKCKKLSEEL